MQLRDPVLLISIVGIPVKQLDRVLQQELSAYTQATSRHGLACIKQYWHTHCSTLPKLPAIALLDQSSCPRGISDTDFVALLTRLTDWQRWQIWDLWITFDTHNCGYVGCQEFTLLVVLMCAAMSNQQLQAVHAFSSSIHKVFAGANTGNVVAGLMQCCQLLGLPNVCLDTAVQELQLDLLQLGARRQIQQHRGRQICNTSQACSEAQCKQSSSSCCPCSSCSCRYFGGVQTSWQASVDSSRKACFCSSKTAENAGYHSRTGSTNFCCSGCSSCNTRECSNRCCSLPNDGCSNQPEVSVVAVEAATCGCNIRSWQGVREQDVQLVLYCTIHLTHNPMYFISGSIPAFDHKKDKQTSEWCCLRCI